MHRLCPALHFVLDSYITHVSDLTQLCSSHYPNIQRISDLYPRRAKRKPSEIEQQPGWEEMIAREAATGKIYFAGYDQWKRPVIIFDNTVQNSNSHDAHVVFLAWNLEFGTRLMSPCVDKYVILINLKKFSLLNNPTLQTTKETIKMLCDCYPERLGHLICYQPPWVFKGVFDAVKIFIDPKTVSKVVFLVGDDADGTVNDATMRSIIGDNWRTLTGVGQPVLVPGCSPGFDFQLYWKDIIARVRSLQQQEAINSQKNVIRAHGLEEVLADLSLSSPPSSSSSSSSFSTHQRDNSNKEDLINNTYRTNNRGVPVRDARNATSANNSNTDNDDISSPVSPRMCFLLLVVYIVYLMF